MKTGLMPGSFDPFTIGHKDIADRALALVDRLVIAVGVNETKNCMLTADERVSQIRDIYKDNERVEVVTFSEMTMDFARRMNCDCIIKGIRSVKDFEYERDQADVNLHVGDIETVVLFARPELASVSSSLVRTFRYFGKDYKQFIP